MVRIMKFDLFFNYLLKERNYSKNTIKNYEIDLNRYKEYLNTNNINYLKIKYTDILNYISYLKHNHK